ncbi:AmpG family muropeptide MFS transporter [Phormidium tenue]|uniref:AmpG family muropeptide MFS transporter n=1 Tax=Phormidium tenue NIES-30 TaxID=549789 RepID=A0A1U7J5T9_9CYAN|nr:AmpG family muropeptide MFS transporter [Phormidium tenue]MBD2232428.1 AmpG family muropeptide MFS transporter [Phormidium tenue FACHB-1052]OKH48085.1 AmpG family muropeptide MFS transporter [Phormidium tenue NIES-30]
MKATQSLVRVFQSRKMAAILLLGIASGLPYALMDDAFRGWMTKAQLDLRIIGWFSLISLPYSLKFLWSPFLDRFVPPRLGRRRGWMVIGQLGLVVGIAILALQMAAIATGPSPTPASVLQLVALIALGITFLSATQDIAIDAYRTDVLEEREMGAGAATYVLGYRIAILLTGAMAFILADRITWPWVYGVMAGLMGLGVLVSLWAPEPVRTVHPPDSLKQAVVQPFGEFFSRLGVQRTIAVVLFILLYKLGDNLTAKMAIPFLGDQGLGFSDTDIGTIRQGLGLVATIVGTLAGGAALSQLGINRSLWIFGGLQALSNLGYLILAIVGKNYLVMVLAINVENFCAGLGTAGFVGFLMSLCNARFSATQFALLSSLMAVGRDLIAGPASGEIAQRLQQFVQSNPNIAAIPALAGATQQGWPLFFGITLLAALPGLMLLPVFAPWHDREEAD